jgi:hypothetical protein
LIIKKAGPLLTLPVKSIFIVLMFLIFAFYRVRFSFPCQTFFQEYVHGMRIDVYLSLIAFLYYLCDINHGQDVIGFVSSPTIV